MPFSGGVYTRTDGTYTGATVFAQEAANGVNIVAANLDTEATDMGTALSTTILKDGTQTLTANIPWSGMKITGYGSTNAPTARTDVPSWGQVQDGSACWGGTAGGTANAITLTLAPVLAAQVATGAAVWFVVGTTNTGATTIATSAQTALACRRAIGSTLVAFVGGELVAGDIVGFYNDGTYMQMVSRMPEELKGADIASATTTNLATVTGQYVQVSGTTTITGLGTLPAGAERTLEFQGALTLTYNATSLILPGAASITTAAGDTAIFRSEGGGNWRCISYTRISGSPVATAGYVTKTGTVQTVAGGLYAWDTTSAVGTATLPASPAAGNVPVTICMVGLNILTVDAGTNKIRVQNGSYVTGAVDIPGNTPGDFVFKFLGTVADGTTNVWGF